MSREVDQRVVQMQFENSQFEPKARETMRTLDALRQTLSFDNVAVGGLLALSSQVSAISDRFSFLGTLTERVFQRMADKAIDTGKKIATGLTIQGADDGFKEYELKMGSVQTIMNGSGASLEKVNSVLDELNTYADKTIYSFSDMTSSIGKFTNAGVGLDEAVAAIQGISNEAALSGATSQQASHAMYNFAQALSSGVVKLIDWKSIENATMATKEFKNELLKTALELGTVTKEGDMFVSTTTDMNGNVSDTFDAVSRFNDSLSSQWLTSDVLIKTLSKYADETTELGKRAFAAAQEVKTFSQLMDTLKEAVGSGWASSFEIIVGNFEEAKQLWTGVNNELSAIVDSQAKSRNELLQGWKDLGGRQAIIDTFANVWKGLKSAVTPVLDAFHNIFPPLTARSLAAFSENLKELTSRLILSNELGKKVQTVFTGFFSVIDIGLNAVSALYTVLKPGLGIFRIIGEKVLDTAESFGLWAGRIRDSLKESDYFFTSLNRLRDKIKDGVSALKPLTDIVVSHLPEFHGFADILSKIQSIASGFYASFRRATTFISLFAEVMWKHFANNASIDVLALFSTVLDHIANGLRNLGIFLFAIKNAISSFQLSNQTIIKLYDTFRGLFAIVDLVKQAFSGFFRAFAPYTGTFEDFQNGVFSFAGFLGAVADKILSVTGYLGGFIDNLARSARESDFFYEVFRKVAEILSMGFDAFKLVLNFIKDRLPSMSDFSDILSEIRDRIAPLGDLFTKAGDAIGKFFSSFQMPKQKLGFFEKFTGYMTKLWKILVTVGGFLGKGLLKGFDVLVNAITNLDSVQLSRLITSGSIFSTAGGIMGFVHNLKDTVTGLGDILGGFKDVMDAVTGTLEALQQRVKAKIIATIAGAVVGLALAVLVISVIDAKSLWNALGAIAFLFGMLSGTFAGLTKFLSNVDSDQFSKFKEVSTLMVSMSASVAILSASMVLLQKLNWNDIAKGLISVGLMMAGLVIAANIFSKNEGPMMKGAAGLIFFAFGIRILTKTLSVVKELDWHQLVKGLVSVGLLIAGIAAAIHFTNFSGFGVSQGLGILALAAGLKILTGAVKVLGGLDMASLSNGLGALLGILTALTVAVRFMPSTLPLIGMGLMMVSTALLAMSGVVAIFGHMSDDSLSKGLTTLATVLLELVIALNLMRKALPGAAAMIIAAGAIALLVPTLGLLSLIPFKNLMYALLGIAGAFTVLGVAAFFLSPLIVPILALAGALTLIGIAALAAGAGLTMIGVAFSSLGLGFATAAASIGAGITLIIVNVLKLVPTIVVAIGRGIMQIIEMLGDAATVIGAAFIKIGTAILDAVVVLTPKLVLAGLTVIMSFLEGLEKGLPEIVLAAYRVITAFINALAEAIRGNDADLLAAIGNLISSIIELVFSALQMLVGAIPVVGEQMTSALEKGKEKVYNYFHPQEFKKLGQQAGTALGGGFSSGGSFDKAADTVATDGLKTLASYEPKYENAGEGLLNSLTSTFSSGGKIPGLENIVSGFGDMDSLSPTLRPVIDMTSADASMGDLSDLFSSSGTFTFAGYDDMMGELGGLSTSMNDFTSKNQNISDSVDSLHTDNEIQNEKLDALNKTLGENLPYLKKFESLQVVMDSGELVGVLEGPLDQRLGQRNVQSIRSGR